MGVSATETGDAVRGGGMDGSNDACAPLLVELAWSGELLNRALAWGGNWLRPARGGRWISKLHSSYPAGYVGFRVPADPQGSNSGVRAEISPPTYSRLVASQGSKLHQEQHKGHVVYTSSGHHCGVIPYSSLWRGGLPQGLMMNNTREELPREGRGSCVGGSG